MYRLYSLVLAEPHGCINASPNFILKLHSLLQMNKEKWLSGNCQFICSAVSLLLKKIFAVLHFLSLPLSVLIHTHTHTQSYTHTLVLMSKPIVVSCYRNAWLMSTICLVWLWAISLLWNILILSNKHMFWIGPWELHLHPWDRFSHILLWTELKFGKVTKINLFSNSMLSFPWTSTADSVSPAYSLSCRPCHSISADQTPKPLSRLLLPRRSPTPLTEAWWISMETLWNNPS